MLCCTAGVRAKSPKGRAATQQDAPGCGRLRCGSFLFTGVPCAPQTLVVTVLLSEQEVTSGPESVRPKLSPAHARAHARTHARTCTRTHTRWLEPPGKGA